MHFKLSLLQMTNDHSPTHNDKTISDLQVKLSVKEETLKRLVDKNEVSKSEKTEIKQQQKTK